MNHPIVSSASFCRYASSHSGVLSGRAPKERAPAAKEPHSQYDGQSGRHLVLYKLRHCLIILLFIAALDPLPRAALAAAHYVGARFVYSQFEVETDKFSMQNLKFFPAQSVKTDIRSNADIMGLGVFTGIDFNWAGHVPLRLETEFIMRENVSIHQNKVYPVTGQIRAMRLVTDLDIDLNITHTLNLWLDIPTGKFPLKPYIGGGIGYDFIGYSAKAHMNPYNPGPVQTIGQGSGYHFAWRHQFGGGVFFAMGKRSFLDLSACYAKKQHWSADMAPFSLAFSSRALDFGLSARYYF